MRSNTGSVAVGSNVLAFPIGARAAERLRRVEATSAVRPVIHDGAWYHEEAIEAEKASTRNRLGDH